MSVRLTYKFAAVPEWLVFDPAVDDNAVRVYAVLARHGQDSFPSLATIGQLTGKSVDTVRRGIRSLAKVGAVVVEERYDDDGRQSSNRYLLAGDAPLHNRVSNSATDVGGSSATDPAGKPARQTRAIRNESNKNEKDMPPCGGCTPAQEAQAILDGYWRHVKDQTGRHPVGITPIAFKKLITPFLEAGVERVPLKTALKAMYEAGRPLTRQGIEAQLDGRSSKKRNGDGTMDGLRALKFDDDGMLINE